jgi:pimeloyl-ACP methyl ester carboxylesterase
MFISTRDEHIVVHNEQEHRDITLHCVQWGTQGEPIVLIHGLTANAFCFQAIVEALAPDHRVFTYDLRGRGDSEKPESGYRVPIHAADLAALIDVLQLERPVIIGHSLGALIALYFAAHYPTALKRLVLIDAGAPLVWSTLEEMPGWLVSAVSRLGVAVSSYEEYLARMQQAPYIGPYWNEALATYFEHDVEQRVDGSVVPKAARNAVLEEGKNYPLAVPDQQWEHVQVPTLLLRAGQGLFSEHDQLLTEQNAELIVQHIAGCRYVNYPTLNHYTIIFGTEPGPVQAIQHFLQA